MFRPSAEEWRDPLAYINRIRPTAEQSGIAKIIPPRVRCVGYAFRVRISANVLLLHGMFLPPPPSTGYKVQ